ncbi:MAG TPA: alpha/beta hydrolase [Nitriliruptorales bacterium]
MSRLRNALLLGLGAATGAAVAYRAERAVMRDRLAVTKVGPPLGSISGDVREIHGPDGVRLTVEAYGPADAPMVVLIHGWCCTGRVWHEQVAALGDRYRLVTYDQPGHGRSSPPRSGRYPLDLFGDTLAAVLEACSAPDQPVVLVGHSLGGATILNLARRRQHLMGDRIRGAILLSTASRAVTGESGLRLSISSLARLERYVGRFLDVVDPRAARYAARAYRASSDISHLVTKLVGLSPGADPRYVDFTEQLMLDADVDMVLGIARSVISLDEDEGLSCLTIPNTILCGTADRITPVELSRWMADRCQTSDLIELPGVGHMTPLEAKDAVNAVIERAVTRALRDGERVA